MEPWAIIGLAAAIALLSGAVGAKQRAIERGPRWMAAFAVRYGEGAPWLLRGLIGATSVLLAAVDTDAILVGMIGAGIFVWAMVGYFRVVARRRG